MRLPGGQGLIGRAWPWVVALAGMSGVGLLLLWGRPLLGAGLVALAVSGALAPPGAEGAPASPRARIAVGLSVLGTGLVALDLLVALVAG